MIVTGYLTKDTEHNTAINAFLDGYEQATDGIAQRVDVESGPDSSAHVHVVFGAYKKAIPYSAHRGAVIDYCRAHARRCVVLESGYVSRKDYYAAGFGGINGAAEFRNRGMPPDRWRKLPEEPGEWAIDGDYYLLIGQVPWDYTVQEIDFHRWAVGTAMQLWAMKKVAVYRPHPLAPDVPVQIRDFATIIQPSTQTLMDAMDDAKAVVTYNSNAGVDAILAGRPVVYLGKNSMYESVSSRTVHQLEYPDRFQWASNLAYAQWNLEEMAAGEAWKHLFR